MSVSKKIGNAVVRNRLKRQIRAIMRDYDIISNVDIFIIARNKILSIDYHQMKSDIERLLKKQKLI